MSHVARSTLIIAVFIGLEKLLGFIRQVLTARTFGLSPELDAFNAANNLPDLLFALISGGSFAIAVIPVFSEYLEKGGHPALWDLFSRVLNLIFLMTAGISVLIAIFANQLVSWRGGIAPGFEAYQQGLVADLMRLNLIATLLFSISGLVIAGLQTNQHFLLPALARSMYDVGALVGVLFLAPKTGYQFGPIALPAFGLGVFGLVYGILLGALLFLLIQIPGLVRFGFRWSPVITLRHPGVKQVFRVMGPRVATMFFVYLVLIYIPDNIASRLPSGAVAALVFGWLFMQVPETLIGTAIGTALLPTLSEQIIRRDLATFQLSLNQSLRVILALTLPSAALLTVVIEPVVQIFGFDASGTDLVVWTARAFLVGLMGHALLEVAARAFYAQQDARTPLFASALMMGVFTLLALLLAPRLGAPGIALANALAFTGEALLLLGLLSRRFRGLLRVEKTLLRVTAVSIITGLGVYGLMHLPFSPLPLSIGSLGVGMLLVFPFVWPEVNLLVKLGK